MTVGTSSKERNPAPRIFVGLSEVAGYFSSVEVGLLSQGIDAQFFNLSPNVLAYGQAHGSSPTRLLALRHAPRGSARNRLWLGALRINRFVRRIRAAILFPWAAYRFDGFILGGHETFLGGPDLWILRRLGKRVVIVFTGSDHRPPYLSGAGIRQFGSSKSLARETRRLRYRVARAERYATAVVALPASAQLHRRPFVDFLAIGMPFVPPSGLGKESASDRVTTGAVHVLHSPTDPIAKGSALIRTAVERCRERGTPIEYRELVGQPNHEVLRALRWCDFVVDEVYSDTPMAKFATEAAYFGKAAIVGSYATALYQDIDDASLPPSFLCHPDAIEAAIMSLASDAARRGELGRQAQEFVSRQWAPAKVAGRLLQLMDGAAPAEWVVHPRDLTYVQGWGVSEETLRSTVRRMIDEAGIDSLGLSPDSRLRSLTLEMAGVGGKR